MTSCKNSKRFAVNIPIIDEYKPVFPKSCVVCNADCNEKQMVIGNPQVTFLGGLQWIFGGAPRVEVYGHSNCVKKLNRCIKIRLIILVFTLMLLVPAVIYELNPFIYMPAILFSAIIILVYQSKNKLIFEATCFNDSIVIISSNEDFAQELSLLNNAGIEAES